MFTKKDLHNGDIVIYRNGKIRMFYEDKFIGTRGLHGFRSEYKDDLTVKCAACKELDIMKVYRGDNWDYTKNELIYDREKEETKEMTLKEICEKLGYNVKIVKGE